MDPLGRCVIGLAAAAFFLGTLPCAAQQGSIQVSAAVQGVTGDPERLGAQPRLEPDFGVSWLQPGSRFGVFQIELRGARRGNILHTGRMYGSLRDLKFRHSAWTIEVGDAYFSPGLGEYRLANLFTPAVTFNGASIAGRTPQSSIAVVVGKTTAWRSIFGNDPEALGQTLGVARLTHQVAPRVEFNARASRVRTSSLKEFSYTIDAGDQIGAGAKVGVTSSLQLVADGSFVSYRRTGVAERARDASYMGGANWLHSRGWLQVNLSRFSPGDFPALNNPLQDRQGVFAAGEYDPWSRVRVSAGWEAFRSNLRPAESLASTKPTPEAAGSRGFGGLRLQVTSRSSFTLHGERGARQSRPLGFGLRSQTDTGSWAAEWQAAIGQANAFVRYSARENVEHVNLIGSSDQRDASAQIFANLSQSSQIFATALVTRTAMFAGGGNTYWQAGGGTQVRVPRHDLWLRAEGTAARNMDTVSGTFVPRESFSLGLNGQLSREMMIAFNVNVDRSSSPALSGNPWISRSTVRLTRTLPIGSAYLAGSGGAAAESFAGRGSGTISGSVYADWNANGLPDVGENAIEGIALRLGAGHSTTGRDGQFSFQNVPVGIRDVGLDTSALPIEFDPPAVAQIQIELSRGDTERVAFGLIPLGAIHGRVIRDANKNGRADPDEEPIDGAILILDGGARSEVARKGRYRFDAIRSGSHVLKLLAESLPAGAQIAGDAEVPVALTREALTTEISFLVSMDKRPEIRRVFPPRGGASATARPVTSPPSGGRSIPRTTATGLAAGASAFAIQIAALNDPLRAREIVNRLKQTGMPAYLVNPPSTDPDAPYRVRVGPYATRAAAEKTAAALEQSRGEKLWVTKEK